MIRVTPALLAELAHHNAGIQHARVEYDRTVICGTDCPTALCRLDEVLCRSCRSRILTHIRRSVDPERKEQLRAEYAYLLELPTADRIAGDVEANRPARKATVTGEWVSDDDGAWRYESGRRLGGGK